MKIKAIIFDFGRTLFDSANKEVFPDADGVLSYCQGKGYRMAVVSLVIPSLNNSSIKNSKILSETKRKM